MGQIGTLGSSIIRTVVPIAVGALLTWLVSFGIEFDPETQTQIIAAALVLITALVQALYYVLCRLVEQKFPRFGILLGLPRTPDAYTAGPAPAPAPAIAPDPQAKYSVPLTGMFAQLETDHLGRKIEHVQLPEIDLGPQYSDPGRRPKHALRGDGDVPAFPTQADLDAVDKERGL